MTPEELKEYNKIVIDVSKEMSNPYKITTIILALLLLCMSVLYFVYPSQIELQANKNEKSHIIQKG